MYENTSLYSHKDRRGGGGEGVVVCEPAQQLALHSGTTARTLLFSALAERHEYVTRLLRNDGVEVLQNQSFNLLTPLVFLVQIASLQ